jgi:hypothetical protein
MNSGTVGIRQLGNASVTKQLETPKQRMSEGRTPTETVIPPKRPTDSKGKENYMEALANK